MLNIIKYLILKAKQTFNLTKKLSEIFTQFKRFILGIRTDFGSSSPKFRRFCSHNKNQSTK